MKDKNLNWYNLINSFFILIILVIVVLIYVKQEKGNPEKLKSTFSKDSKSLAFFIEPDIAKIMVKHYVESVANIRFPKDPVRNYENIERSVYFSPEIVKSMHRLINLNYGKLGIKAYFGMYDLNNSDINKYLENEIPDKTERDKYKSIIKDRFSIILVATKSDGTIDEDYKLLNLGGLCPPKCVPESYEDNDPLYHD